MPSATRSWRQRWLYTPIPTRRRPGEPHTPGRPAVVGRRCALPGILTPFTATATAGEGLFSAAFSGGGEDRARFKGGKPSPSVPPSSSAKISKTQSLSRPSARPDPLRLRLRLPEGLGREAGVRTQWSQCALFHFGYYNVVTKVE